MAGHYDIRYKCSDIYKFAQLEVCEMNIMIHIILGYICFGQIKVQKRKKGWDILTSIMSKIDPQFLKTECTMMQSIISRDN